MRFVRPMLALAALAAAALVALPAAADDGRRHVMTPTQKIDMVRDLPDIAAFEKDGLQYDLGYIYPIRTVNGASVAAAGGVGESGYVLYHDDRYIRADASVMADLEMALGEDPTQGYTPPKPTAAAAAAAAAPWGANATPDAATGEPMASSPARRSAAGSVGIIGTMFLFFLALFVRVRLFRDLVIGGMLAGIAAIVRRRAEPDVAPAPAGADDRLSPRAAAQLARLDSLAAAPAASPAAASGGFGRKGV